MNINPLQNKMLHALLNSTGMIEVKQELVYSFSNQRTSSSRELSFSEATVLISYLKGLDPKEAALEKMRRKIIAKAHNLRWELPGGKVDIARVNAWCEKFGGCNKKLNAHSYEELVNLVTAFDKMYKYYISKID